MTIAHLEGILEVLRTRAHEKHAIATCRIAWALAVDTELKGQRGIARASGVSLNVVKQILPEEGQEDPFGLIRCLRRGHASIDPEDLQAGRYAPAGETPTPERKDPPPVSTPSTTSSVQEERVEDCPPHSGSFRSGVDRLSLDIVQQALDPSLDVWKQAGQWAWALAVLTGWQKTELTMGQLREWTQMTDRGVRKVVAKWEESYTAARLDEPGKATRVLVWGQDNPIGVSYVSRDHAYGLEARHLDEAERHRQRMTTEGLTAWRIVQGKEGPEWMHGVPAEVVAQGEDAVYDFLVDQAKQEETDMQAAETEQKATPEALSATQSASQAPVVTQVPVRRPSPSDEQERQRQVVVPSECDQDRTHQAWMADLGRV